jgi:hypothetical protein
MTFFITLGGPEAGPAAHDLSGRDDKFVAQHELPSLHLSVDAAVGLTEIESPFV